MIEAGDEGYRIEDAILERQAAAILDDDTSSTPVEDVQARTLQCRIGLIRTDRTGFVQPNEHVVSGADIKTSPFDFLQDDTEALGPQRGQMKALTDMIGQ